MLLELAEWLGESIRAFNVFSYLTLRAVLAALTALDDIPAWCSVIVRE